MQDRHESAPDVVQTATGTLLACLDRELAPMQSDLITTLNTHALEVFGTAEKADRWLHKPNRALGGVRPTDLIASGERGVDEVDALLGRIEHGIFS